MAEKFISVNDTEQLSRLFGNFDENIRKIQKEYNVAVVSRDGIIKIIGDENNTDAAEKAVQALLKINSSGTPLTEQTVIRGC